jgi:hypothetical protein
MINNQQARPKTSVPHKFFERHLDNDLPDLQRFLESKYKLIQSAKLRGVDELGKDDNHWIESGSLSTVKWREYNVFQLYHGGLYNLYKGISSAVKEACEYYDVNFEKQQYYVQGWFNINHADTGKLNWHDHGGPFAPHFHGYYCVNAEPSITHYQIEDGSDRIVENNNKNNRLIISEMGHPHAMGDWDWDGPRITVAYDVEPLESLINNGMTIEQHWTPLL